MSESQANGHSHCPHHASSIIAAPKEWNIAQLARSEHLFVTRWLSLSETRSGRIGDAIRPGLAPAKCGRRSRWGGLPENPYSRIGAFGFDCSSLRKIEANAEDAARQIRRHGQGSRVGSNR